jgi:hypothetical protein
MADMAWPMTRAMASLAPPAAVGTTRVIGFSGKAAIALPQEKDAASATAPTRRSFCNFILSTPMDCRKVDASRLLLGLDRMFRFWMSSVNCMFKID